jgi:rRNA maturation endonuclease Nob1
MLNWFRKFVSKIEVHTFRCMSCRHIFQTTGTAGKCPECGSYNTTQED